MANWTTWDPNKAAEIGAAKGNTIGYVAGLYSTPGMTNLSAATAEAINQDGGSIYQDLDTGHFSIRYDRDTKGGTIWHSDALGVTCDYSGDSFVMTPDAVSTNSYSSNNTNNYYNNSFAQSCDNILNQLGVSTSTGTDIQDNTGLTTNQTRDPISGRVIDKAKSQEIDDLKNSKTLQHKFDNISKLINKVNEAQNKSTAETSLAKNVGEGITGGAATGAVIGSFFGFPVGTIVGGLIGGVVGLVAGGAYTEYEQGTANSANGKSASEAAQVGQELKDAIGELSDEELLAFERYYYENTGVEVSQVLEALEVDSDSSTIAQQTGITSDWLDETFDKMDNADKLLDTTEATETKKEGYSMTEKAKLDVYQKEANRYYNLWLQSIQPNAEPVVIDGKTYTSEELLKLYEEKVQEYEDYQNSL